MSTAPVVIWLDDNRKPDQMRLEWLLDPTPVESCEVVWVKTYHDFIDAVKAHADRLVLLCLDFYLGGGADGYDATKWFVENYPHLNSVVRGRSQSISPQGRRKIHDLLTQHNFQI